MYVRFKVSSSSSNGYGMKGMVETIRAVATADAGASISDPAGTTYFKVVSNTEAGGWTVDSSATTSASYSYSNWTGAIQINSDTNKSGYSKSFRVFTNSTTSQRTYWGAMQCEFKAYDGNTARYSGRLAFNNSYSSSASHNMWCPNNGIYDENLTWHFSCTSDYAWLWYEFDGSVAASYANNFAGVSELR